MPCPSGQVADLVVVLLVDADGDELGEPRPGLVEHPERAVAGVDELDGALDDAPQHGGQVEIEPDREHGVEQLPQAARTRHIHGCDCRCPLRASCGRMRSMTEPTRVFLLDDHEVVRRGVRDLLEAEDDLDGRRRGGYRGGGRRPHPRHEPACGRARRAAPRRRRDRGVPRGPLAAPRDRLHHAHLVRRRRGRVRRDHGGRLRLRPQAGARQRARRRHPPRRPRRVPPRPRRHDAGSSNGSATARPTTSSPGSPTRSARSSS